MPNLIEVNRSGSVVWIVVDGHALPVDWIEDAHVSIDPDRMPFVTVTLTAAEVRVTNSVNVMGGYDDGEAEEARDKAEAG